jgi:hypothetical protein
VPFESRGFGPFESRYGEVASRGGSSMRFAFVRIFVHRLSQASTPKSFGPISRHSRSASRSCLRRPLMALSYVGHAR